LRYALNVDGVRGFLGGFLDFALDGCAGLADDRFSFGRADVNLRSFRVEGRGLSFVFGIASAGLILWPAADAFAALLAGLTTPAFAIALVFAVAVKLFGIVRPRTAAIAFVSGTAHGVTYVR